MSRVAHDVGGSRALREVTNVVQDVKKQSHYSMRVRVYQLSDLSEKRQLASTQHSIPASDWNLFVAALMQRIVRLEVCLPFRYVSNKR